MTRTLIFRTAAQIGAESAPEPEWIIKPYVARGSITELVGKAKLAGKTTFVMAALRSVLSGTDFLGQPTTQTPVVYLTEERQGTFREALRRADLLESHDLHVVYWHETRGLDWEEIVGQSIDTCHAIGACLLVVDTVSQFAGLRGDAENNSGDALHAVEPLQEAAAKRLAVLAVRHERKGGGDIGESGRGSSAFTGAADIWVALRRGPGQTRTSVRVLHAVSRFDETPNELAIEKVDAAALKEERVPAALYIPLGSDAAVVAHETREALMACLPTSAADAKTIEEITAITEARRTTVQEQLKKLTLSGTVKSIGKGEKGDPYRYFRPVQDSAGTPTAIAAKQNPSARPRASLRPRDAA